MFSAAGECVAVRRRDASGDELTYLFSDHLGSTSITANANGTLRSRTLYHPWGEVRYQTGALPTDYRVASLERSGRGTYTGQYSYTDAFGLMYYNARWYDPALGRFAQADTVVPGMHPMAFDRYAYVFNSPLKYIDPDGHYLDDGGPGIDPDKPTLVFKMPSEWSLSSKGLTFLMLQEGFSKFPYNDGLSKHDPYYYDRTGKGVGNCTGGYGHKIHNGPCDGRESEEPFVGIKEPKAREYLKADIKIAEAVVQEHITVPVTQSQYDALVSLFFNWGYRPDYPDKINLINAGRYIEAGLHFLLGPITSNGKRMPGLMERRYAEAKMFLSGYNVVLPELSVYMADPYGEYQKIRDHHFPQP